METGVHHINDQSNKKQEEGSLYTRRKRDFCAKEATVVDGSAKGSRHGGAGGGTGGRLHS